MRAKLEELLKEFESALAPLNTEAEVLALKGRFVGKKGGVSAVLKGLASATPEERRQIGPFANTVKESITRSCQTKLGEIKQAEVNEALARERLDLGLSEERLEGAAPRGGLHPRTIVQNEIEDIFVSMGFDILDGPHIEDEFHNFEALNIPADHPARDMQDTFWFSDNKHLLRTHTSPLQVRGMLSRKPPFRFIAPGLVFRCERTDASHEMVFAQLEGMMVDQDISVANLIYFMKTLLAEVFQKEVPVRLRPGYFPFVEPGFELDIQCSLCGGKGCRVCRGLGWVELLPCGMIHPNVLRFGNIDPEKWNGFAFGLGLDRLVMMRYGIDDIRHLAGGDLRFLEQFRSY